MATWIAHMRVADYFMKKHEELNNVEFLVGSIGPDCNTPLDEGWTRFTPSKETTHWIKEDGNIDAADFYEKHLTNRDDRFPFYMGYYFHLLTDIEWAKFFKRKKEEPLYAEGLARDESFIWTIKKDWYGYDILFLKRNPDFAFHRMFAKIKEFENIYSLT